MGCTFSCKRLSSKKSNSKNIRIVHLNGYIEEIDYPVKVSEITGKPTKHFLFTHTQLLSAGSAPLKPDTFLEPSRVYFLLPYSLFDANVSPLDLAPIARKLTSMAQSSRSKSKSAKKPILSSRSPNDGDHVLYGKQKSSPKSRSWKPVLDTIGERSFNLRSESDLMEIVKVDSTE